MRAAAGSSQKTMWPVPGTSTTDASGFAFAASSAPAAVTTGLSPPWMQHGRCGHRGPDVEEVVGLEAGVRGDDRVARDRAHPARAQLLLPAGPAGPGRGDLVGVRAAAGLVELAEEGVERGRVRPASRTAHRRVDEHRGAQVEAGGGEGGDPRAHGVPEHERAAQLEGVDDRRDVAGVGVEVPGVPAVGEAATADVEDDRPHEIGEIAGDEVHGDRGARDAGDDHERDAVGGAVVEDVQAHVPRAHPAAHRRDVGEVGQGRLGEDAGVGGLEGQRSAFRKGSSR